MGTPAFEKDNPATRAAHEAASRNAAAGMPAGRSMGAIRSGPPTRVTTAAMRAEPTMLPPEEHARRDSIAREMGILEPEESPQNAREFTAKSDYIPTTAREVLMRTDRRLPDFLLVQRFDLIKGVVVVDGMELPIPEDDQAWMRSYAIQLAADEVTKKLAYAMAQFSTSIIQQVPPKEAEIVEPAKETKQRRRKGPKSKVKSSS
jgi:hypothetical protein